MTVAAAPVAVHRPLPPEEAARGDFYALLARLLHSGPDQALLAQLGAAPRLPAEGDAGLAKAWDRLVAASSVMDAEAACAEYDNLFVGVGKARISIYAGHYTGAHAVAHPRVRIQQELAALGLARRTGANEPEDHLAGLLDVMRVLVAGGAGRPPAPVAEQKRFFQDYLGAATVKFFTEVGAAPEANYYRAVAELGTAFVAIESESFQLD